MKKLLFALAAAALLLLPARQVRADNLVGGHTTVALDPTTYNTLAGLFDIGIIPPATISGLDVSFPITADTATTITHSGGLSFDGTNTPSGVGTTTDIEDFIINTSTDTISGTVVVNGGAPMSGVTLFDFNSALALTLDPALASALSSIYGVPDLAGSPIGAATIVPTPEPSTLSLFGLALIGVGATVKRRLFAR